MSQRQEMQYYVMEEGRKPYSKIEGLKWMQK